MKRTRPALPDDDDESAPPRKKKRPPAEPEPAENPVEDLMDLEIDQNSLDTEWLKQPKMYFVASMRLADAKQRLEYARRDADLTLAEVKHDIRANPARYDLEKTTVDVVDSTAALQPHVIDANDAIIQQRHVVDVLSGYLSALDHRKKGLENLVDLFIAGYFAQPTAKSPQAREAMTERIKDKSRRRTQRTSDDE